MFVRFVTLAAAVLCLVPATVALADPTPTPSPAPTPVSLPTLAPSSNLDPYARMAIDVLTGVIRQQIANSSNSATGQVTYFKRFDMQVETGRNSYRQIHLFQGTVINPRGVSIKAGERVDVSGSTQADGSLVANVINIQQ